VLKKKLFIKTYGCQMNVYDSERMADLLEPLGYKTVNSPDSADMVILNTCHIREKASEKMYSELGRIRAFKENQRHKGHSMVVAVAGCVAQAEGEEIMNRVPFVDMVFGPQTYHRLPEMIAQAMRSQDKTEGPGRGILDVEFPVESKFDHLLPPVVNQSSTAFLSIQEGCNKFCHFCVVPYTRGAEYSRPVCDVIRDTESLVDQGVCEITLLGQNVNAYHGSSPGKNGEWGLGRLINCLADIDGLKRIRYTTSHPRDVDSELIDAHRDVDKLMPYLHLPVQSGSDQILKSMNRQHTADHYRQIIEQLRESRPDLVFSTDIIVGYPGESDKDFTDTLNFVRDIDFAQAYSFKYSRRPGTPGASMENQVPEHIKSERLEQLQELLRKQQRLFYHSLVNTVQPVLFEKSGRYKGQIVGRSPFQQPVHVEAPTRLIGHIIDVHIVEAHSNSLSGRVVTHSPNEIRFSQTGNLQ
jgi:tRNA-2-methylthio-N6-dimethylallyladenosine synthase